MRKICPICKKEFEVTVRHKVYCSQECKEQVKRYSGAAKVSNKCKVSIDEVIINSLKEGLSYGQYVDKYKLW